MIMNRRVLVSGALSALAGAALAPKAFAKPPLSVSIDENVFERALKNTERYFSRRFTALNNLAPTVLLGPVLDAGTYYYRIGAENQPNLPTFRSGWGMEQGDLEVFREFLIKEGVPPAIPEEIRILQELYFKVLNDIAPQRKKVAKHYPGGDEILESTEVELIRYDSSYPIGSWINNFQIAITGDAPAWGIMLSHAAYDLKTFPGIDGLLPLASGTISGLPPVILEAMRKAANKLYGDANLSDEASELEILSFVPASLNPVMTRYLRDVQNYRGVLVGDWYNMRGVQEFCLMTSVFLEEELKSPINQHDALLLMTTYAGVNYVRPLAANLMGIVWKQQHDGLFNHSHDFLELRDSFLAKMDDVILETYNKLKKEDDPKLSLSDIARLPFDEKFELIACSAQGINFWEHRQFSKYNEALREGLSKQSIPELYQVINMDSQVTPNDLWQRGAIMVMVFRKNLIEEVLRSNGIDKQFPNPPSKDAEELAWIRSLFRDPDFKKIYDGIDWDQLYRAPEAQRSLSPNIDP